LITDFLVCIGFFCLRFAFCFFSGVFVVVPVHGLKRKGQLKPATIAQFFLIASGPCCKNPSIVLEFAAWSGGDEGALEKLFPLVQPELHRLAHHYMSRERPGHTLRTTAILNGVRCGLCIIFQ